MEEEHIKRLRRLILNNETDLAKEYINYHITGDNNKKTDELLKALINDISLWNDHKNIESEIRTGNKLNEEEIKLVKKLLSIGQKLNAVNYVIKSLDISLKEAKEIVDTLEEGTQKTETIIFGEEDSLMLETEIEEESFIEFGATEEDGFEAETDLTEIPAKRKQKTKKSIFKKESEAFTFEKILERDKRKKRTRSNSGCMLMLTYMIVTVSIIAAGIYLL